MSALNEILRYEPETGKLFWVRGGSSNRLAGKEAGCRRSDGYILVRVNNKLIGAHRIAVMLMTGEDAGGHVIDHINGNPSDNRWENLRVCRQRQNRANSRIQQRQKSSIYKGVTWFAARGKWMAKVGADYRSYTVGYFDDEREAARAYNRRALELFGEFARLNEVPHVSDF